MNLINTATKRILGKDVRQPAPPVVARDMHRTVLFPRQDQMPGPSSRLMRLALDVLKLVAAGEVSIEDLARRPNVPDYFDVWPGEHYRVLAAFVVVLRPKVVIEIGTFSGLSALAMKKYLPVEGKITTFDVRDWRSIPGSALIDEDFAGGRLEQRLENLSEPGVFERNRGLLESADFLFIDAPKDGVFEYRLFDLFKTVSFRNRPIAMLDDIKLWSMLRFWRELAWPKLDITSLSCWSGTGLVEL